MERPDGYPPVREDRHHLPCEPSIDSRNGLGDVHAAFDRLASCGNRGKVLVRFS